MARALSAKECSTVRHNVREVIHLDFVEERPMEDATQKERSMKDATQKERPMKDAT